MDVARVCQLHVCFHVQELDETIDNVDIPSEQRIDFVEPPGQHCRRQWDVTKIVVVQEKVVDKDAMPEVHPAN